MKKRLISTLLVLILVFSMVSTMSITASAENTINIKDVAVLVTVNKGNTMSGICNSLKVNYNDVKNGILVANDFSSETQLTKIYEGQKIWVPTSKSNSAAIVKNAYAFDEAGNPTNRTTGGGVATVEVDIPTSDVITYTIRSGDTIGKICKANGLDYDTVKEAIVKLNPKRFSSVASLGKIQPSWTIYLPASNATAKSIVKTITDAEREAGGSGAGTAAGGEAIWGYVVKHTMARGETIKGVCNALGMSYNTTTSEMVKKMNNIKNLSSVNAGATYWFPSTYSNGTGYTVYSHTVVNGDTCGKLCSARGINYNSVATIMQGLNPNTNLNNIKRGQTLLILGPAGASGATAGGINVVVGGNGGNGGNGSGSTYAIKRVYTTSQGSISCLVNGSAVDRAAAGAKVTVVAKPATGNALKSLTYTYASGGTSITQKVTGGSFTMPSSQVSVTATFTTSAYKIHFEQPKNGSMTVSANGAVVQDGDTIQGGATICATVTANKGYKVDTVKLNGSAMTDNKDGTWTMTPGAGDVQVVATMKASTSPVPVHNIDSEIVGHGALQFVSEGQSNIYEASEGSKIIIKVLPESGYSLKKSTLATDGPAIAQDSDGNYYFIMSTSDVKVHAEFEKTKTYTVKNISTSTGVYSAANVWINNVSGTEAKEGDSVIVGIDIIQAIKVTWTGIPDPKDTLDIRGNTAFYSFKMPAGDVTFKIEAAPNGAYSISNSSANKDAYSAVRIYRNGGLASYADKDDTIVVEIDKIGDIKVTWTGVADPAGSLVITGNTAKYTFKMPANNVTFDITPLKSTKLSITDKSTVSSDVYSSVTIKRNGVESNYAYEGDTVTISIVHDKPICVAWTGITDPKDSLKQNGNVATYTFTMGSSPVEFTITQNTN